MYTFQKQKIMVTDKLYVVVTEEIWLLKNKIFDTVIDKEKIDLLMFQFKFLYLAEESTTGSRRSNLSNNNVRLKERLEPDKE